MKAIIAAISARFKSNRNLRWLLLLACLLPATFITGYAVGDREADVTFHDMLVNDPEDLSALVTPKDRRIKELAAKLGSLEAMYRFVRDNIAFDPALPAVPAGEVLAHGKGSCLGKAVLLCSLYRAAGLNDSRVRVVTGEVEAMGGPVDHAWLELEYQGECLQQDATELLGRFEFAQFKGTAYTKAFIRREGYVFNDNDFAVVSRLNMLKDTGHPPINSTIVPNGKAR